MEPSDQVATTAIHPPGTLLASTVNLPMLFAGRPSAQEAPVIEQYRKEKRNIVYFLTPEEAKDFPLASTEAGVIWSHDGAVKKFLFDHIHEWMGAQVGILDGQIGATVENKERGQKLASIMNDVIQLWSFDTTSAQYLFKDKIPQKNTLKNHRHLEDGTPFQFFKGKGKGMTTILVAAGPSLDDQWEDLLRIRKTMGSKVGLITCGRSYKQVMKYGLQPEFVHEVEQFEWNDRLFLFAPEPPKLSWLVGPLTGCPNVYNSWPNKGQICVTWDHNYADLMGVTGAEIAKCERSMDGGNSIAHHMFNFACWLGSETICLAGFDFAYPEGHKATHADGTFHMWGRDIDRSERNYQTPIDVPCTAGGMTKGSQPYRNFCTFMEVSIQKQKKFIPGLKVVNFSPRGQKIEGTVYEDIKTWGTSPGPSSSGSPSSLASGPVPFSASLVHGSTLESMNASTSSLPSAPPAPTTTATSEGELKVSDSGSTTNPNSPKP